MVVRRLLIKLLIFLGIIEGLGHVDFMVLISALALVIAGIVCTDLLFMSPSSRAQ
jgi:hypothetical protein